MVGYRCDWVGLMVGYSYIWCGFTAYLIAAISDLVTDRLLAYVIQWLIAWATGGINWFTSLFDWLVIDSILTWYTLKGCNKRWLSWTQKRKQNSSSILQGVEILEQPKIRYVVVQAGVSFGTATPAWKKPAAWEVLWVTPTAKRVKRTVRSRIAADSWPESAGQL